MCSWLKPWRSARRDKDSKQSHARTFRHIPSVTASSPPGRLQPVTISRTVRDYQSEAFNLLNFTDIHNGHASRSSPVSYFQKVAASARTALPASVKARSFPRSQDCLQSRSLQRRRDRRRRRLNGCELPELLVCVPAVLFFQPQLTDMVTQHRLREANHCSQQHCALLLRKVWHLHHPITHRPPLTCTLSCKKKDTDKSLTYSYDHYSPPTTPFANFTFDDLAFRDIVPQRSPTQPDSKRSSCAFSDTSSDDNSDDRYHSEASAYLRKFQSTPAYSPDTVRQYRPRYNRASTSQYSFSAAPSLSHTPASSVSYSLPYTPATRPLPPRTKPSHSGSYGANAKSIDLVTPLTAPSSPKSSPKSYSHKSPAISRTSTSTIEGEIIYAKSPVPEPSIASGSLGRLLASTPR